MSISNDRENPFAPPKAAVLEAPSVDGDYVEEGRKIAAGRGLSWFSESWGIFRRAPGTWVLMFVIFAVVMLVFAIIPFGGLVTSIAYPAVAAGLMLGCKELEQGGALRIGHLFAGFSRNAGNLMLVGLLYLVGAIVVGFIVGVGVALLIPAFLGGAPPPTRGFSGLPQLIPVFILAVLVAMALMLPLIMALWFAPALVVFHDAQPMAAMKASFRGCLKNLVPFLVYGAVGFILAIVAAIPVGLGFLVYGPIIWITMYVGYRDIFLEP